MAFDQKLIYSPFDYSYYLNIGRVKKLELKGNFSSVEFWLVSNHNFHGTSEIVVYKEGKEDHQLFKFENGELTRHAGFHENGELKFENIYGSGNILKSSFFPPNSDSPNITEFIYESDLLIQKINSKNSDTITFEYDQNRQLLNTRTGNIEYQYVYLKRNAFYQIKIYARTSRISEISFQEYDPESRVLVQKTLNSTPEATIENLENLDVRFWSLKKFDTQNRIILEQHWENGKMNSEKKFIYSQELLTVSTWMTSNGTDEVTEHRYNDEGKLISKITRDHQGNEVFNVELTYNENGDVKSKNVKSTFSKDELYFYEYEYDQFRNWTKRTEIINGRVFKLDYRIIRYLEN